MEALAGRLAAYLAPEEVAVVRRAHAFGAKAHTGQQRKTGEPYIAHPLAVAGILADLHVDSATLCAALLHDVIEDTAATRAEIAEQFGEEIAALVDAVTKLTQIRFETREQAQAAYFRKMMLAVAGDLRVMLIKLADRLHNMRTLGHLATDKRRRIARETLEIYAPIANRLGMSQLSSELEELGFEALYPLRSRVLDEALRRARGNRHDLVGKIEATLRQRLDQAGVRYRMESREKHLYSVYKKMRQDRIPLSEVYDVYALRIVVDSVDDCYRVLGLVHNTFKPLPNRFKDYIAIPKANGYQSLHTALFTPFGVPAEIQIRTEEMDRVANEGVAAHWSYKDPSGGGRAPQRAREWLQSLLELQRNAGDPQEFLDSVKVDLFPDEVYVFTPKGRILALPAGATAVDFAYAVHSDIGDQCVAVRIDRRLAPLSSVLETGQTVEIITAKTATPHPSWLNFIVTGKARAAIRHFLKNIDRQKAIELGRRLLEIELARLGTPMAQIPEANIAGLLREFSARAMDDLMEDVGLGKRLAAVVATHLVSGTPQPLAERSSRSGLRRALRRVAPRWLVGQEGHSAPLAIKGTEGLVVSYGKCCRPIPGDPIRGYVSAGRGVVIHVDGCPSTAEFAKQPDKWLDVEWQPAGDARFPVDIRVEVVDQRGELATLAAAIADADCNIANVQLREKDGIHAVDDFTIEVRDRVHLARVMKRLRQLKSVRRISRKRG
ncbi:MAG: RelA/SpoT family protein [Pseudomonadota bacterium]